jgi:hypothetical protein
LRGWFEVKSENWSMGFGEMKDGEFDGMGEIWMK